MAEEKKVRYAMVIDLRRCIGCHSCTVACKSENNVPLGVFRGWVKEAEKGTYPNVSRERLPRLCNHCAEAPCVDVCPVTATYQTADGTVIINYDRCIGCKYCIAACPYNSRFINPIRKTADKCDFCYHRITKGLAPACVSTCVGEARIFGNVLDPNSEVAKLIGANPVQVVRSNLNTEPHVYYIGADTGILGAYFGRIEGDEK